jgi:hypothetical protein
MKGRPWAKFDVGMPKDGKVATLSSDGVRWAFVAIVLAAKEQDRQGFFDSLAHLKAVVSGTVADCVEELVDKGLLSVDPEGGIHVSRWTRYQIDPTAAARAKAYRERKPEPVTNGSGETAGYVSPEIRFRDRVPKPRSSRGTPQSIASIVRKTVES